MEIGAPVSYSGRGEAGHLRRAHPFRTRGQAASLPRHVHRPEAPAAGVGADPGALRHEHLEGLQRNPFRKKSFRIETGPANHRRIVSIAATQPDRARISSAFGSLGRPPALMCSTAAKPITAISVARTVFCTCGSKK